MADHEYDREMAEAIRYAEEAEVVCIILPLIQQCLVYDSRSAAGDPPRIWVSAPVGGSERRLRHVNRARPHLEHARRLAAIPWTGSIRALHESGVWEMLQRRMGGSGFPDTDEACERALHELEQWERSALVGVITGRGPYTTLWQRNPDYS